jgi:hypothetical protein
VRVRVRVTFLFHPRPHLVSYFHEQIVIKFDLMFLESHKIALSESLTVFMSSIESIYNGIKLFLIPGDTLLDSDGKVNT